MTADIDSHFEERLELSALDRLLDRPLDAEDLRAQTKQVSQPVTERHDLTESALLFTVGADLLALRTRDVVRVARSVRIHRIPHRSNAIILGLGNIEGELTLCASLAELLGLSHSPENSPKSAASGASGSASKDRTPITRRLVVIGHVGNHWACPVEGMRGVARFDQGDLHPPPLTVERALGHFSEALLEVDERQAALLDVQRLLSGFKAALS